MLSDDVDDVMFVWQKKKKSTTMASPIERPHRSSWRNGNYPPHSAHSASSWDLTYLDGSLALLLLSVNEGF